MNSVQKPYNLWYTKPLSSSYLPFSHSSLQTQLLSEKFLATHVYLPFSHWLLQNQPFSEKLLATHIYLPFSLLHANLQSHTQLPCSITSVFLTKIVKGSNSYLPKNYRRQLTF